ncbi:MAG: saccharopine dehydrogenase NADP-binding domain-containing protein [Pseudomonadales bacterium]|nr:saccharopine dehydrogenase NADP-binding domain-containing protein [Pseudomonadales bacterium]
MSAKKWMIYGANGYTGRLIAQMAAVAKSNINKPILAGRTESQIKPLAESLNLPWCTFSLDQSEAIKSALTDVDVLLHCAGPFSATSAAMVDACIATQTHYLDITGEIAVLEAIKLRSSEAKAAGISLIPAVGFDVVPTDCLANILHKALPDATHLEMAFYGEGGASPGTVKTMIEMLGKGGFVRSNGKIEQVPAGYKQKSIRFTDESRWCMTIPWGDISTAYTSTGIKNIEIYTAAPKMAAKITRLTSPFLGLMNYSPLQNFLKRRVENNIQGPDDTSRNNGAMHLWGKVKNAQGDSREALLDVAEGYQFTAMSSLAAVERLLTGDIATGTLTPAQAFGDDFVLGLKKSQLKLI